MAAFALLKPCIQNNYLQIPKPDLNPFSTPLRQCSSPRFSSGGHQIEGGKSNRVSSIRVNAIPDWPLMAVMVEHMEGERDLITHKSFWHLSDQTMKNVYMFYIMFTCWRCCFFGAAKDPYYDSEAYRKDGGDCTVHWVYEKQEDIEESARAELWREELIEEISKKLGVCESWKKRARKKRSSSSDSPCSISYTRCTNF